MNIVAEDIKAIHEKLKLQLEQGFELVAYNVQPGAANKNDLHFFRDQQSFEEFSKVNNSDHALYFEYSTRHVLNCVDAILNNKINFSESTRFAYADGVYSMYDPAQRESLEALQLQLKQLGFDERLFPALDYYVDYPQERFDLIQKERNDNEKTTCVLHFERHPADLGYELKSYDYSLRIAPEVPDITINGISAKELDHAMNSIDWSIDHHRDSLVEAHIKTADGNDFLDRLDMITRDVNRLYKYNEEGRDAAERLMYKHWHGEPWEPTEISLEHVCRIFEWKKEVDLIATPETTVVETYQYLKQNALLCADALPVTKEALEACLGDDLSGIKPGEELMMLARHFYKVNMHCLEIELYKNGWDEPFGYELQWQFNNKSACFDITVNKEVQQEKMQCRLQFEDAGNGWYLFKQFDATLYHQVVIAHAHINGVNTNYLEAAMKKADWYYEYSESNGAWDKGFAEVRKINDALNTLCQDNTGRIIATQLWNNHVPLFTIDKPVIIRKCEEEQHLYQRMQFSAETPVGDAHRELKNVVLKNEMHHHVQLSPVKEQTPVSQKENEKPRHSHRPKIN
ncbi:hypothetical protein FRZ67_18870 [Panacibacter ginsenosidivorans]|uniref:Uncharacterized protein n=1 Tax=Panacibacter ginsenosidivorans TaxID=1813871 RepID=A0A5B8VE47_9BACT|nr:hypothetical protein [Panacibacter ginsenosidivorans]QEC69271.1 hypothetical protein FRZ67_18870 [Panacibacter ginsenosidivorans]